MKLEYYRNIIFGVEEILVIKQAVGLNFVDKGD